MSQRITTAMMALECLSELGNQINLKINKECDEPDVGVNKHIFVALNFDGYDLEKSTFQSIKDGVINPAIKKLVEIISDDYLQLRKDNPESDFAICFKTPLMPDGLSGNVASSKSAGLSVRVATQYLCKDDMIIHRVDVIYEFKRAVMTTATVEKIIAVYPVHHEEWSCDVLCTDGIIRKIEYARLDENGHMIEDDVIKQGYQFEYESELPPHLCQPDYKTAYETIDKFLIESEDVLLGNIMKALKGRINPEVARNIIRQRLLIDKS